MIILHSEKELYELVTAHPYVYALFTGDDCPPCKVVKPHFEAIAARQEDKDHIYCQTIDLFDFVYSDDKSAQCFNPSRRVRSMPTLVLFKNGAVLARVTGITVAQIKQLKGEKTWT